MRGSPQSNSGQFNASADELTLVGLLSLDLAAIVSLLFALGALAPASLILTLGYLPVGFLNAAFGRGDLDRLVFAGTELSLVFAAVGLVLLLAGPTLYLRVNHFRRILRFSTLAPGQIRRLSVTAFEFRVDYVYWFQQRVYAGNNAIRRNHRRERRQSLRPGHNINVLVDSYQPDASIILELYTRAKPPKGNRV